MRHKYLIESGEDRAEVDSLAEAKVIAGEWQLERARLVTIECSECPGLKFAARLRPGDGDELNVVLEPMFDVSSGASSYEYTDDDSADAYDDVVDSFDPWLSDDLDADDRADRVERIDLLAQFAARMFSKPKREHAIRYVSKQDALFDDAELERARRVAMYSQQLNRTAKHVRGGHPKRAVIHESTGQRYESVSHAADATGIARESMSRKVRTPGSGWMYADAMKAKVPLVV